MSRTPGESSRAASLFEVADAQAGYFSAAQARELGYQYPTQHYHKSSGAWQEAGHGLFRLRDYPITEHEQLARLTLWSRDRAGTMPAVVSHDTALFLHGVGDLLPERVHLTVPPTFRKPPPPGVVLHKATLGDEDVVERHGFRMTGLLRTLLDLTHPDFPVEYLLQAIEIAHTEGRISEMNADYVRRALMLAYKYFPPPSPS